MRHVREPRQRHAARGLPAEEGQLVAQQGRDRARHGRGDPGGRPATCARADWLQACVRAERALCQARSVPPRLTRLPVARSRSRGAFLFARRVVCCIQNAALHDFERRKRTWRSGKRSASFALPEI